MWCQLLLAWFKPGRASVSYIVTCLDHSQLLNIGAIKRISKDTTRRQLNPVDVGELDSQFARTFHARFFARERMNMHDPCHPRCSTIRLQRAASGAEVQFKGGGLPAAFSVSLAVSAPVALMVDGDSSHRVSPLLHCVLTSHERPADGYRPHGLSCIYRISNEESKWEDKEAIEGHGRLRRGEEETHGEGMVFEVFTWSKCFVEWVGKWFGFGDCAL